MIEQKANIFEFATTELSQDAVFCYLLDCFHDPANKEIARRFLELIGVQNIEDISHLDIKRQQDNIDIKVTVQYRDGTKKFILIEDKVYSKVHSNQLQRYKDLTIQREHCRAEDIIGKFFKIGEPLPWETAYCTASGFTVLGYTNFFDFLKTVAGIDPVLDAFYAFFKQRVAYYQKIDSCSFDTLEERAFEQVIGYRYGQRKLTEWLMKTIFTDNYRTEKLYDVNNFGSPCTQYAFIFDNEAIASDWNLPECDMPRRRYSCFFRIDRNTDGWYIAIRLYFRHGANSEEAAYSSKMRSELLNLFGKDDAPNRTAKKEKTLLLYHIDSVQKAKALLPTFKKAVEYLLLDM